MGGLPTDTAVHVRVVGTAQPSCVMECLERARMFRLPRRRNEPPVRRQVGEVYYGESPEHHG